MVPRVGGNDSQAIPNDWESQCKDIYFIWFLLFVFWYKLYFAYRIARTVAKYNIPPDLVVNADQTGLPIFASGKKTRVVQGTKKYFFISWYF